MIFCLIIIYKLNFINYNFTTVMSIVVKDIIEDAIIESVTEVKVFLNGDVISDIE